MDKEFKPMKELVNALWAIVKAIKGESSDSNSEIKSNKIIGLNGPDKILVWVTPREGDQEYRYVDTYQEAVAFMNDPNYYGWIAGSIFVYKNNDLNVDDTLMYSVYDDRFYPNCIMIEETSRYSKRFVKLSEWQSNLDVSKVEDADKWYVIVQDENNEENNEQE